MSDQSRTSLRPKLRRFYDVYATSLCRLGIRKTCGNLYLLQCYDSTFKQPSKVFYKNGYSERFRNFRRKTPVLECLFKKFAGLKVCNFTKNSLQLRCFPVNIVKCLRTPILKNISKRLLLYISK